MTMASSQRNLTSSSVAAAGPVPSMPRDSDAIAVLAALLCGVVCLAGLALVARCAWLRRQRRSRSSPAPPHNGANHDLLRALPTLSFDPSSPSSIAADCPICLSEFAGGDRVRALPGCGHAFHAPCVDAWLVLHSSCPSCRHPVATRCGASAASSGGAEAKERAVYRFLP